MDCLQFGRGLNSYSPEVRIFCLTVHFYSPRAFEYIRSVFNQNLPCIRTIQKWCSVVDTSPGFTLCSMDILRAKIEELKTKNVQPTVSLIFDEMAIRKQSLYDPVEKDFKGHVTAGRPVDHEMCTPLAKDALVLMVSGIQDEFKIPIAYFFINGLCAEEKAAMINEALFRLNQIGAIVTSIVFDGLRSNITTMKILGVDYKNEKPYFINKFNGMRVYAILDASHMLKLMRNVLGKM